MYFIEVTRTDGSKFFLGEDLLFSHNEQKINEILKDKEKTFDKDKVSKVEIVKG